jgi:DNA-binding response OmpR family regulator
MASPATLDEVGSTYVKILLVEDDPKLGPLVRRALESDHHDVTLAPAAKEARECDLPRYDVAVVDWMLPDGDGLELCTRLRRNEFEGAILMLTCRGETKDRIAALDAGVDDYLTKPFAMGELLARVRALGRRGKSIRGIDVGPLHIDVWNRNVFADGVLLAPFSSKELDLLLYFARRPNRVLTKAELGDAIWEGETTASNLMQVAISRLRDKLDRHASMLETVRGEGYRLRVPEKP